MRIKERLHRSYSMASLAVFLLLGLTIVLSTQQRISRKLDLELKRTNELVYKMVANVFDLNRSILLRNLSILDGEVNQVSLRADIPIESDAEHFITQLTDYIVIETLEINGKAVFQDHSLVDRVSEITGGTASVLQIVPMGLLRVSSNIRRPDGKRATQIYYPNDNDITRTIRAGKIYVDKTLETNQLHIVAYKPIRSGSTIVGALQVGIQPDIEALRKHILDIDIGLTGTPYIVDTDGIMIISERDENQNVYHLAHIKKMIRDKGEGTIVYWITGLPAWERRKIVTAYRYMPDLQWIIASGSRLWEFYGELGLISWIILVTVILALAISVTLSRRLSEYISDPINELTEQMSSLGEIQYDFGNFAQVEKIRKKVSRIDGGDEEIRVLASTFAVMLEELEKAQRDLISRHRKYREMEIVEKIDEILTPDREIAQERDISQGKEPREEAAGDFFDVTGGPEEQSWYLIGFSGDSPYDTGYFMMLGQTFLNSIFKNIPDADPIEAVGMLNLYITSVMNDMDRTDFAFNFALLICSRSGWTQYVGKKRVLKVLREKVSSVEKIGTHRVDEPDSRQTETYKALFKLEGESVLLIDDEQSGGKAERKLLENREESADELSLIIHKALESSEREHRSCIFLLKRS